METPGLLAGRAFADAPLAHPGRAAWRLLLLVVLLSSTAADADPEDAPGFLVRGRLTVRDSTEVPKRFAFLLRSAIGSTVSVDAAGREGRFEVRMPRAGSYLVLDMRIDGEPCRSEIPNVEIAAGHEVEIVVDPLAAPVLQITDAVTQQPVPGARVYTSEPSGLMILDMVSGQPARGGGPAPDWIPGPDVLAQKPFLADSLGKVVLPPTRGPSDCHVVAAGHAWVSLRVPPAPPGPVPVELRPGGTMTVKIARWSELLDPRLAIRGIDEDPSAARDLPAPDASGTLHVDGVAVGRHVVMLQRGWRSSSTYGTASVEIAASKDSTVSIEPHLTGEKLAALRGSLTVPASWKADRVHLSFQGIDDATEGMDARVQLGEFTPGRPMRFVAPSALAFGRYRAEVSPLGFYQEFDLVPGGGEIEIRLPQPVEVHLRVLDAESGREMPGADVTWGHPYRQGGGFSGWSARFDSAHRTFWFLAPPHAHVRVTPRADGYYPVEFGIDLPGDGIVVREVRVRRVGVLVVRLQLDGKPFVNRKDVRVTLSGPVPDSAPGGNELRSFPQQHGWIREGLAWIDGLTPGKYRLAVGPMRRADVAPEGFAPVVDRDVEVVGGKCTEILIDLQRAK